jgi:translation initiation factor 5B
MTDKKIRQPIVTVCGHVDHGKCLTGDTIIPLVDGTLINAKELFEKNYQKSKARKIEKDIIQKVNNITLFSNSNSKILPAKASHIWKREKEKLIEIRTAHGDIIKTTPEHPYFVFSLSGNIKIKAEDLKKGDYIAIPKSIRIENSNPKKIILEKLKKSDFLCFLNSKSENLIKKIKKNKINKIEQELKIKFLAESLRKSRIRFRDLVKLCEYFKISDNSLYNMIETIKNSSEKQRVGHTSRTIKLPDFKNLEELGYLIGCIAGDGHLAKTQVLLDNNDKEIQKKYSEYLKKIFNIDTYVKQNHTCQAVINNVGITFKKFLQEIIGIPDKQKSANIQIPEIAQKNKEIFRGLFSGLIDTDGYVSLINNSIELTSKSNKLIRQCSILLLNFDIPSTIYKKKGFYYLRISNKEPLEKFLENFNLRLTRKLKRVINAHKKAQSSRIFDIIPVSKEEIKKLKLPPKINKLIPYFNKYIKSQNITRSLLKKILNNISEENQTSFLLRSILENDLRYVKVLSKKSLKNKEKYVYDFTVPKVHNFIAERTILHNTSILDCLRGSYVQEAESGGITQKISFTSFPLEQLKKVCPLIEKNKIKLEIPGFLFIDTPGHAAFTNLRKRGGNLADLAVLVIDINEGIKPQTAEVIQILKLNSIPFVIALNKIDNISGWRTSKDLDIGIKSEIENQSQNVREVFNERYMTLIGALNSYGFDSDLFYNIENFTKKIALVPCSARTKEGLQELIMVLCGLSQKYLTRRLELGKSAKGVIFEIKKEKSGNYIEAILHDGILSKKDEISIANLEGEPIITKIRVLEEIEPLSSRFKSKNEITASTGLRMQIIEKTEILPGMPFKTYEGNKEEIKEEFKREVSEKINSSLSKRGIIVKADSLGSLEALLTLLSQKGIPVVKAGIGNIKKADIISAKANLDINEIDSVIVGFNVGIDEESKELISEKIKIITEEVIYRLIENLEEFREEKQREIEKKKMMELISLCKLRILPQYIFRNSNPAIFGVRIEEGKIIPRSEFIDSEGKKIGRIKNIQLDNKSVEEATRNMEVAISIPGINFERVLKNVDSLYSDISEKQFRNFKKNKELLSSGEITLLQEIAEIKRQKKPDWGN